MSKVLIVDISGKVRFYDRVLFHALRENCIDEVIITLLIPGNGLLRIIPRKYSNSTHIIKRLLKVIEGLLNYIYLLYYLFLNRVDVLHFQWLPFLEVCSLEYYYFKILKFFFPKLKIVLTVHNIYPHNSSVTKKNHYNLRFRRIAPLLDRFIVHTKNSKNEVVHEFGIDDRNIEIIHHGIFIPKGYTPKTKKIPQSGKWCLIMFGNQSLYKGTDIFIKSLQLLPDIIKNKVRAIICGKTDDAFLKELQSVDTGVEIIWKPTFLNSDELYSLIDNSDIILLPYRAISQSGVLLLSLFFRKIMITSDLPSFKETLIGFSDDMFFKNGDAHSLANLICKYVGGSIDGTRQFNCIDNLNAIYSWDKSAIETMSLYEKLFYTKSC